MSWEEIDVPKGVYIGWGNTPGQYVQGAVLNFNPTGATTPPQPGQQSGTPCPLLEIELTAPAASFDRDLNRTDYPAGDRVCLSVSQKQLQRAVSYANLKAGDLVRITLKDREHTPNGTVKVFGIAVDRGAALSKVSGNGSGGGFAPPPDVQETNLRGTQPVSAGFGGVNDDEPPF